MRQCVRWRVEEVGPVGLGKGQGGEAVGGGGFRVRASVLLAGVSWSSCEKTYPEGLLLSWPLL